MSSLHKNQNGALELEPNKEQCGLLSSNKASLRYPFSSSSEILSKDTLRALDELGNVLRKVHRRMVSEGYIIVDGRIQKI